MSIKVRAEIMSIKFRREGGKGPTDNYDERTNCAHSDNVRK